MITILVEKLDRTNTKYSYMASVESGGFSTGRSPAEAIGSLIGTDPERYGLVIKNTAESAPSRGKV